MNKKFLTILLSVLLPTFLVGAVVYATTSVGTNISVEGDLDIVGTDLQATTGTLNISKPSSMTTVEGTLNVDEAVTLDSTLTVTATTTLNGTVVMGTSGSPMSLGTTATNRAIEVYTSSASVTGGTSVLPIYMRHTVLGTGGVGHRAEFHTRADVVVGTWINALKGYMEFDASLTAGRTTGLASAVCAEMKMPNSAVGTGEYYPLEIELVGQSNLFKGVASGFMTLRATGSIDGINSDGYFMHVTGLTAGATNLLSLTSQTLKTLIGAAGSADRYMVLSQMEDGVGLGNSTTDMVLGTSTTKRPIEVYTSSASTDTGTSIKPIYMRHTVLGTGGVGHRAEFHTRADVVVGTWINALKGYMEFDASLTAGRTTGLASAVCAEMKMPNSAVGTGEYYPLEIELVGQSNLFKGAASGFMTLRATGNIDGIDSDGYFMHVTGLTAGATAMLSSNSQTLKTRIGSSTRYLVLSQAADSLSLTTTATAVDLTAALTGSTADSVLAITTTDTQTQSSGYTKSLSIAHTIGETGDKTGSSESTAIGIDYTIAGDTPYAYGIMHWSSSGGTNPIIGFAAPISIYQEDLGSALSEYAGIDVGLNFDANAPSGRYTFMRFRNHSALGNPDSIFLLEGADTSTYLLELATGASQEPYAATGGAGSTAWHADVDGFLKVKVGADIMYIPLFHD